MKNKNILNVKSNHGDQTMVFLSSIFSVFFVSVVLLAEMGCTLKTEKSPLNNATFRVDHVVEPGQVTQASVNKAWNLPSSRLFHLTACVLPISQKNPILKEDFEITGADGRKTRTATDSSGCLHWSEVFEFDYFARPTYIEIERQFKALGRQRGTASYKFAINPWSGLTDSKPAVVDLRRTTVVSQIVSGLQSFSALKAKRQQGVPLVIRQLNNVRLELPRKESPNVDYNLHFEFTPSVMTKDMDGFLTAKVLERGVFFIQADIVKVDLASGKRTALLQESKQKRVEFKDDVVVFDVPKKLASPIDHQAKYEVVLSVGTQETPPYIKEFFDTYEAQDVSSLKGGQFVVSSRSSVEEPGWMSSLAQLFDFKGDLKDEDSSSQLRTSYWAQVVRSQPSQTQENNTFRFGLIELHRHRVLPGKKAMEEILQLDFKIPVSDTIGVSSLQDRAFKIYRLQKRSDKAKGKLIPIQNQNLQERPEFHVTSEGSLHWTDSVMTHVYKKPAWETYDIVFEDILTQKRHTHCVKLAPSLTEGEELVRDCDSDGALGDFLPSDPDTLPVPRKPFLIVNSVAFEKVNVKQKNVVRPDLSLDVSFGYNFQAGAQVYRFDSLSHASSAPSQGLHPGWWVMTFVTFQNEVHRIGHHDDENRLVATSSSEKVFCNVTAPQMNIELKLTQLGLMQRMQYFAIQFKPVDETQLEFETEARDCGRARLKKDTPIVIDRENDLYSPPYVFSWTPAESGSVSNVHALIPENFADPKVQNLMKELLALDKKSDEDSKSGGGLHQLHVAYEKARAQEIELSARFQKDESFWAKVAQSLHMQPVLMENDQQVQGFLNSLISRAAKLASTPSNMDEAMREYLSPQPPSEPTTIGLVPSISHQTLFKTLNCLDQAFWMDHRSMKVLCGDDSDIKKTARVLCYLLKNAISHDPKDPPSVNCEKPFDSLLVEERLHVHELDQNQPSKILGGLQTSLPLYSGWDVGSFEGTDYGQMLADSVAGSLTGEAGFGGSWKNGVSLGAAAGLSAAKSLTAVRFDFTREWTDNAIGAASSFTLKNEEIKVQLNLEKYRRCYMVYFSEQEQNDDSGQGHYICGPVEKKSLIREEMYYVLYDTSHPTVLNSWDPRNRLIKQIRGQRQFYRLLSQVNSSLRPFHRDGLPMSISAILNRIKNKIDYPIAVDETMDEQMKFIVEGSTREGVTWNDNSKNKTLSWQIPFVLASLPPKNFYKSYAPDPEKLESRQMSATWNPFNTFLNNTRGNENVCEGGTVDQCIKSYIELYKKNVGDGD